jgi:signal transduction histidine kinase
MRRLLGVLRDQEGDSELAPQPGIAQLEVLAETVRAAGLDVEVEIAADCAGLPAALELSVYRIVQEALTNTLKHADAAHARVRVQRKGDALVIDVIDDGVRRDTPSGAGHGLLGMQERVALFGGTLHAGRRTEGGWSVHATVPVATS